MIDYKEVDRYYSGTIYPIVCDFGGMALDLGEPREAVLYILSPTRFIDVETRTLVEVLGTQISPEACFVVESETLRQMDSKKELKHNTRLIRRLQFDPSKYNGL